MSKTQCVYPQVDCIVKIEDVLGKNRIWTAKNAEQARFLSDFFNKSRNEVMDLEFMENIASWDHNDINKFLADRGFNIALQPFAPNEFGAASVLDVLVKWLIEGEHVKYTRPSDNYEFDAAKMSNDTVEMFTTKDNPFPVVKVLTEDDVSVYMTQLDFDPKQLDLIDIATNIQDGLQEDYSFKGLFFPCVDLDQKVDIKWLLGMTTNDDNGAEWKISQALQQTKLRMNEKGAHAKSAVAVGVRLSSVTMPKPPMVIENPFLTWFDKPGLNHKIIAGYITEDDWNRVEDLDDM